MLASGPFVWIYCFSWGGTSSMPPTSSLERSDGSVHFVLRGELFKANEATNACKCRWFDLLSDGTLQWFPTERPNAQAKGSISLVGAIITVEPPERRHEASRKAEGVDPAFGLRISPANAERHRSIHLRASSEEERRIWVEALDAAAHAIPAYSVGSAGRAVRLRREVAADGRPQPLGIELVQDGPCVAVQAVSSDHAAEAGLLVGDVIVAVDEMVVRTMAIAETAFAQRAGDIVLRLGGWNREARLIKRAGISGLTLCAPVDGGAGVLVQSVARDSAAADAGLNPGDRILAVNGQRCRSGTHEHASGVIRSSLQEVKLVVTGLSVAVSVRKDADGRLGLGFTQGPPPRGAQGAMITDVMPGSAAHQAGLRNGDLLISVDGNLVTDQQSGIGLLSGAARALTCVVWRPPDAAEQDTAISADDGGGTANVAIGAVPWAYYTHAVLPGDGISPPSIPPNVPLYADLTRTRDSAREREEDGSA
jgi:S1-C subfamily serine protease